MSRRFACGHAVGGNAERPPQIMTERVRSNITSIKVAMSAHPLGEDV